MKTAAELIAEARGYGLDVEAERCDVFLLRADLMLLRALPEPLRAEAVARLNEGLRPEGVTYVFWFECACGDQSPSTSSRCRACGRALTVDVPELRWRGLRPARRRAFREDNPPTLTTNGARASAHREEP